MHSLICFFQYCFSVFAQKRNEKRDSFTKPDCFFPEFKERSFRIIFYILKERSFRMRLREFRGLAPKTFWGGLVPKTS